MRSSAASGLPGLARDRIITTAWASGVGPRPLQHRGLASRWYTNGSSHCSTCSQAAPSHHGETHDTPLPTKPHLHRRRRRQQQQQQEVLGSAPEDAWGPDGGAAAAPGAPGYLPRRPIRQRSRFPRQPEQRAQKPSPTAAPDKGAARPLSMPDAAGGRQQQLNPEGHQMADVPAGQQEQQEQQQQEQQQQKQGLPGQPPPPQLQQLNSQGFGGQGHGALGPVAEPQDMVASTPSTSELPAVVSPAVDAAIAPQASGAEAAGADGAAQHLELRPGSTATPVWAAVLPLLPLHLQVSLQRYQLQLQQQGLQTRGPFPQQQQQQQHPALLQQQQQQQQQQLQHGALPQHNGDVQERQALPVLQQHAAALPLRLLLPAGLLGLCRDPMRPWQAGVILHLLRGLPPPACHIYAEMRPFTLQRVIATRARAEQELREHREEADWQLRRAAAWRRRVLAGGPLRKDTLKRAAREAGQLRAAAGMTRGALRRLLGLADGYSDWDYVDYVEGQLLPLLDQIGAACTHLEDVLLPGLRELSQTVAPSSDYWGAVPPEMAGTTAAQAALVRARRGAQVQAARMRDWSHVPWRYPPIEYVHVKRKGVRGAAPPLALPGVARKVPAVRQATELLKSSAAAAPAASTSSDALRLAQPHERLAGLFD